MRALCRWRGRRGCIDAAGARNTCCTHLDARILPGDAGTVNPRFACLRCDALGGRATSHRARRERPGDRVVRGGGVSSRGEAGGRVNAHNVMHQSCVYAPSWLRRIKGAGAAAAVATRCSCTCSAPSRALCEWIRSMMKVYFSQAGAAAPPLLCLGSSPPCRGFFCNAPPVRGRLAARAASAALRHTPSQTIVALGHRGNTTRQEARPKCGLDA
jgi:hypothetical protein